MSTGQRIDYCFMSESFKPLAGPAWLRKGDPVPARTHTARFNRDESNVSARARWEEGSNVLDWFGEGRDWVLAEDIIGLGGYGRTLTVLFSESPPPDAEDDDEESLGDFEPTFHRSRRR